MDLHRSTKQVKQLTCQKFSEIGKPLYFSHLGLAHRDSRRAWDYLRLLCVKPIDSSRPSETLKLPVRLSTDHAANA